MLNRDRIKMIMALALPIIGGMVSQNVLNLVDTAMVGTLGDAALAAVNLGGFANWLSMAFITGLATGVQAMSARRLGEGRTDIVAVPLNGGLLQAIALGIPTSVIIYTFVPVLFPFLIDDPAVVELGVPYLRIRLLALTFIAMNFA
ncbi:MAG: MATE family multidrug resistance protein, partial [Bradymonadia bacterium]